MLTWLKSLFGAPGVPAPPTIPPPRHPVEQWAHDIATKEFHGRATQITVLHGRFDKLYCVRDSKGQWLAEVGYNSNGQFRITREKVEA